MSQLRAVPLVLQVLDDGLRLYRRNLAGFMLVATTHMVVFALLAISFMAFVRAEIGSTFGWLFLAAFLLLVFSYPLVLYTFATLSRATAMAVEGKPISLLNALRIHPGRGCVMVIFNVLFSIVTAIVLAIMSYTVNIPIWIFTMLLTGFFASTADSALSAAVGSFFVINMVVNFLWSTIVAGAWLASVVYALQAFVLEQTSWSDAFTRAIVLMSGRFWRSLLMFLGAGAIFSTLVIAYIGSLAVLVSTVYERLDPELPALVIDAIIIVLVVGSLVVLLPPMAIWMALFYQQLAAEREGAEISQQVAAWRSTINP